MRSDPVLAPMLPNVLSLLCFVISADLWASDSVAAIVRAAPRVDDKVADICSKEVEISCMSRCSMGVKDDIPNEFAKNEISRDGHGVCIAPGAVRFQHTGKLLKA